MGRTRSMHWTHRAGGPTVAGEGRTTMISNEFLASEILGHGAYLCVRRSGNGDVRRAGAARISTLAERLQLRNEFDPGTPPSRDSIALLQIGRASCRERV